MSSFISFYSRAGSDPYFSNVVFLLGVSGTNASDESSYAATVTNSSIAPVTTTAQSKWSGRSLLITGNGNDSHCYVEHSGLLNLGERAWTAEGWFYISSAGSLANISLHTIVKTDDTDYMESGYSGTSRWINGNTSDFGDQLDGFSLSPQKTLPLNQWFHLAVVNPSDSNYPRTYLDGTLIGTWNGDPNFGTGQCRAAIGWIRGGANSQGTFYAEDVRVTLDVERYTGSSFTVPSAQFPTF